MGQHVRIENLKKTMILFEICEICYSIYYGIYIQDAYVTIISKYIHCSYSYAILVFKQIMPYSSVRR